VFALITVRGETEADLETAATEVAGLLGEGFDAGTSEEMTQNVRPQGVSFRFEVSGQDSREPVVEVGWSAADVVITAATMSGLPLISNERARAFLADAGPTIDKLLREHGQTLILRMLAERAAKQGGVW
jgi:hypothetical protein